jgi:GTP-binding protein
MPCCGGTGERSASSTPRAFGGRDAWADPARSKASASWSPAARSSRPTSSSCSSTLLIIAANKWDLVKDRGPDYSKEFDAALRRQLKFLEWAPVMHISAVTGERTPRLLEMIDKVAASRRQRIPTAELNRFVTEAVAEHPPASPGRHEVRILYAAQTGVAPPTFVFFTNVATSFHFSYERFLQNRLREAFGFFGTPIRIHVRRRSRREKTD